MVKLPDNTIVLHDVSEYEYAYVFHAPAGWPQGYLVKWKLGKGKREHIKFFNSETEARRHADIVISGI